MLPSDTPEEVLKKKKKVKAIKAMNKQNEIDRERDAAKSSWQKFDSKAGKKRVKGFMQGHKQQSIFSVGDGVDAKVGVTGSGKGITDFEVRKKYKLG